MKANGSSVDREESTGEAAVKAALAKALTAWVDWYNGRWREAMEDRDQPLLTALDRAHRERVVSSRAALALSRVP